MSKTRNRAILLRIAILGTLLAYGLDAHGQIPTDWVTRWEEDLEFARTEAVEQHPNLFHSTDRETWNAAFDDLIARLPQLDHSAIAVELSAIMASVGDGHTRLTLPLGPSVDFMQGHSATPDPNVDELLFHQFPIRFFIDDSGVYIRRIERGRDAFLGRRVVGIGRRSANDAIAAISPTIRRDNRMQLLHHLPMHLVLSEILAARDVIADPDRLRLRVISNDGMEESIELRAVPHGQEVDWVDAGTGDESSSRSRNKDKNFWLEQVGDPAILYVQFNEVYDSDEESIADFATRLSEKIEHQSAEALVVDLRRNRGGDGGLSRPLLHAILCSQLNDAGRLFILVGRTTFSAAMLFALDIERHTDAIFVGEPTGSIPNSYGDSRKLRLPHSGLTLRVSTRYWQSHPTDDRPWIAPHVSAPTTMADYLAGRDPAMDAVRAIVSDLSGANGELAEQWDGVATVGSNTFSLLLDFPSAGDGRATIKELDFATPLLDLQVGKRRVAFAIEGLGRPIQFEGGHGERWMVGLLGEPSRRYPFVLQAVP